MLYLLAVIRVSDLFPRVRLLCFLLLTLWVPIFMEVRLIMVDTWSLVFLLFSFYFVARYTDGEKYRYMVASLLFQGMAVGARVDNLLVVAPMVLFFVVGAYKRRDAPSRSVKLFRLAFAPALFSLSLLLFVVLPNSKSQSVNKILYPALWDIVGIYLETGKPSFIAGDRKVLLADAKDLYSPYTIDPLVWDMPGTKPVIQPLGFMSWSSEQVAAFEKLWLTTVLENPMTYLRTRYRIAYYFLFEPSTNLWFSPADAHTIKFNPFRNKFILPERPLYTRLIAYCQNNLVFLWALGWYVPMALVFALVTVVRNGKWAPLATLLLLTIVGVLGKIPFITANQFRFGNWIVVATIILLCIMLEELLEKKSQRSPEIPSCAE